MVYSSWTSNGVFSLIDLRPGAAKSEDVIPCLSSRPNDDTIARVFCAEIVQGHEAGVLTGYQMKLTVFRQGPSIVKVGSVTPQVTDL